jgi:methylmalonyl-CoA mutase C-terminal domain/subunit
MNRKRIRVLIAKPGLDGHDVGAKIVVRALFAAGFEVIYTGLRKSVEEIAAAARDEDVDVIGFSILSGSHLPLCRKFKELREEFGLGDKLWVVGGTIPREDLEELKKLGVDRLFPSGTPLESIVDSINESVA